MTYTLKSHPARSEGWNIYMQARTSLISAEESFVSWNSWLSGTGTDVLAAKALGYVEICLTRYNRKSGRMYEVWLADFFPPKL